jgi:hypothetical protein
MFMVHVLVIQPQNLVQLGVDYNESWCRAKVAINGASHTLIKLHCKTYLHCFAPLVLFPLHCSMIHASSFFLPPAGILGPVDIIDLAGWASVRAACSIR